MMLFNTSVNRLLTYAVFSLFIVLFSTPTLAQWPVQFGSAGDERIVDMAVDSQNNIVVVGLFSQQTSFATNVDGEPIVLNSAGGDDVFIASYASNGQINWARRIGGADNDDVVAVEVGSPANRDEAIYITGNTGSSESNLDGGENASLSVKANQAYGAFYETTGNLIGSWSYPNYTKVTDFVVEPTSWIWLSFVSSDDPFMSQTSRSYRSYLNDKLQIDKIETLWEGDDEQLTYTLGDIKDFEAGNSGCDAENNIGNIIADSKQYVAGFDNNFSYSNPNECRWVTEVDSGDYRGDIYVKDDLLYYSAAGIIQVIQRSSGEITHTIDAVSDRSLIVTPKSSTYEEYRIDVKTNLGGLAVDNEKNIYISGVYTGAPTFGFDASVNELPDVGTTPTIFIAKYSLNEEAWQWVQTTLAPEQENASALKNTRISLSENGNSLYVAGSSSIQQQFNDNIESNIGPEMGVLSLNGDNTLHVPVGDLSEDHDITQYKLTLKINLANDADFPMAIVNSPVTINGQQKYFQVILNDAQHITIKEPITYSVLPGEYTGTTPEYYITEFELDTALAKNEWHSILIERFYEVKDGSDEWIEEDEDALHYAITINDEPRINTLIDFALTSCITCTPIAAISSGEFVTLFEGDSNDVEGFKGFIDDIELTVVSHTFISRNKTWKQKKEKVFNWTFDSYANATSDLFMSVSGETSIDLSVIDENARPQWSVDNSTITHDGADYRDGYISVLDTRSGEWVIPNNWEVGEAIEQPDSTLSNQPTIKIDGEIATDFNSYVYWNVYESKLYAVGKAPGVLTIEWEAEDGGDPIVSVGTPVQTNNFAQVHIAGTTMLLAPASRFNEEEDEYESLEFVQVIYPANSNYLVTVNDSGQKVFNRSSVRSGEPYVVLQYTATFDGEPINLATQASYFQVVYTKDWEDVAETSACTIGQEITDERHDFLNGQNGVVLNSLSRYDSTLYNQGLGSIFPVNLAQSSGDDDALAIAWYRENNIGQYWADTAVKYECQWPENPQKIVIANQAGVDLSQIGSFVNNPSIYRQPNVELAGFNPNEEHAMLQDGKVFALRNDLNDVLPKIEGAMPSEPYVLVKYQDGTNNNQWAFEVLAIEASNDDALFSPSLNHDLYVVDAGQKVLPPVPLNYLQGCEDKHAIIDEANVAWRDYRNNVFARASGDIQAQYYYPMQAGFDYDLDADGAADIEVGECLPWLDRQVGKTESTAVGTPINISYQFEWPESVPIIKPGETLFTGKEAACSNGEAAEEACYLPDINGQAAVQVIYDQALILNSDDPADALVKLIDPLSARSTFLAELPDNIVTYSSQGKIHFSGLPYILRSRLIYDTNNQLLTFSGSYDDTQLGDPYLLPNIMTTREKDQIIALASANNEFVSAVTALYYLTRNPNRLDLDNDNNADERYLVGLQSENNDSQVGPQALIGTPMALTAGRPASEGYITLAFDNDDSLTVEPSLKVLKLDASQGVYRGNIWVVPSDNIFDDALTLRHTADFAGDPDNIDFQWYYQADSGGQPFAPELNENSPNEVPVSPWIRHPDSGKGALDITLSGANILTLSDNWFITRYGGTGENSGLAVGDNHNVPSPWAGEPAGEGTSTRAMLATGWIKRVVGNLNLFDQRVNDFHTDELSTIGSMISQAGEPYAGDIPLNPEVVNNLGIIESYQTLLNRGKDLSVNAGIDSNAVNTQLLNAATRVADLYMLLGNEAYADAQDPTIGFATSSELGSAASSIFTFQNQLASPLEEELVLLRGRDDSGAGTDAHPVNNRLFWNFTQGSGEVAYIQSYGITDQNADGFIDETDARILYPQGHGDAWGNYLTSVKTRYDLLKEEHFTWIPRTESVSIAGKTIEVDYLDERKFAAAASAKSRVGSEIINLTYRDKYVETPQGQWQGYKDTDEERAWGLDGWGRRSGQGAYFDWVTANAILPAEDPNPEHTGIEKIDRTTVVEIQAIASGYKSIQAQIDKADAGINPLGLAKGVVPFDIDPSFLDISSAVQGKNHFDQIAERAQKALDNAVRVFDYASQQTQSLRSVQDDVDQITELVLQQERDYKQQLIEIYGYPYTGDMGAGKTYPSDYDGPDYYHYMYVNSDLVGSLSAPSGSNNYQKHFDNLTCGNNFCFALPTELEKAYENVEQGTPISVDFPVVKGATWEHLAPSHWQQRRAPGKIQHTISDLLQAQAQLAKATQEHENLLQDIEASLEKVVAEFNTTNETIDVLSKHKTEVIKLNEAIKSARSGQLLARSSSKFLEEMGEALFDSDTLWQGVGRGYTAYYGFLINLLGDIDEANELSAETEKEEAALQADINLIANTTNVELLARIKEFEHLWRQESVLRIAMNAQAEVVQQNAANLQSIIAEGERLIDERVAFNKSISANTELNRYSDMTFRIFRNDALAKYRAQFDLAARYVYLAATAYDYETNLLNDDSGSGSNFLANIVKQRTLGQVIDGEPIAGSNGLADVLARLTQNFDVYRGQLGFNNPQVETNRFSLRKELFRITEDNDEAWRKTLEASRVDNLWDIPEFVRYARPFTVESAGEQPGLVIKFDTTVTFGLNFFGHELGGGDSAYDPTNFATKIRAVGTWFSGYDFTALSNTPRVYLLPVGMDVLRSPSGDNFDTREWRVVDQKLPAPFTVGNSDLADPNWSPINDSLSDTYGDIRRISSFRAYHDSGEYVQAESIGDSRLVGRSVWNTQWMLVIPGGTLKYDAEDGLNEFIHGQLTPDEETRDGNGISDILLHFQTYGFSGN